MNSVWIGVLGTIVRCASAAVGGYLVNEGYLQADDSIKLQGFAAAAVPFVWGITEKFLSERKTKAREVVAVQAGAMLPQGTVVPAGAAPAVIKEFKETQIAGD